jgi:ApbE superfamily uncharacterized protein (UPF0280 family)
MPPHLRRRAEPRTYRSRVRSRRLARFTVTVKETNLLIHAARDLAQRARELVLEHRAYLEAYIQRYPAFASTLEPWPLRGPAPAVVSEMIAAAAAAGVGPMAAVAGAIAEQVGRGLLALSAEVIVENGGDVFLTTANPATVAVFAGASPLSMAIGLRIACGEAPMGVCTSSGTVGHSLSFGKADAVCVVSLSTAVADAAATAIGNRIRTPGDIAAGIRFGQSIRGVRGILVIVAERLGVWGDIELVDVDRKKG